jgi:hypothetical protein
LGQRLQPQQEKIWNVERAFKLIASILRLLQLSVARLGESDRRVKWLEVKINRMIRGAMIF